ncbi:MAG: pyrroloquinoline quinone-dependent dehydrogenase [Proteobacteria bacterium]|nr:pyrroloquinoline quinone-dependent dehydrogenase [Pseudomonadota bacterium]
MRLRNIFGFIAALPALCLSGLVTAGEGEGWGHYGGSERGLQYSALSEINKDNVKRLTEVWRYRTGELGAGMSKPFAFEANPILVEGLLYLPTGSAIVMALDPATGAEIWRHDPKIDRSKHYAEISNRGVTSWIDPEAAADAPCRHRIFVGTLDARLIALDGATGKPCVGFGEGGQIYLNKDVRTKQSNWVEYTITSPPVVVGDVLVVGSAIGDNRGVELELGIVRGINARTGAEIWRWDPIPRTADDPAFATWVPGEAARNGAANAWPPFAADSALGLVYVPTGSASPDFYGGERAGDNLYANSLVALRAATGEMVWYQQLVHHDVWDYDLPAQPTLVELRHDGKIIPAVLQATKMGLIFSFNRETGEPIFAIEERAVPQGGVDGEHLSKTQPFPVAPPPVVRHGPVTRDDAWGLLYFDTRACRARIETMRSEGIYTPPSLEGSINLPGFPGGINWGGIAFDPAAQIAVVNAIDGPMEVTLIPRDEMRQVKDSGEFGAEGFSRQAGTPYGLHRAPLLSPLGMPCIEPPWGTLTAIDMEKGTILWQVPLGTIEDLAPAIVPNFAYGVPNLGGPIITGGGLIFIAAAADDYIRAYDLENGSELWRARLPAGGQATPMTYYLEGTGRQYVVIAAGGHAGLNTTPGDYVIAYALP